MMDMTISWSSPRSGSCRTRESMLSLLEIPLGSSASAFCSKISLKLCLMTATLGLASLRYHDLQTSFQELITDCGDGLLPGPEYMGNPIM